MLHFWGGGVQEGPACSSGSTAGQCEGRAAAPCSAGTSAPSPQGAVVKEMAGRGDIAVVEDRPDPPVFGANTLLSWLWLPVGLPRVCDPVPHMLCREDPERWATPG